MNSMIKLRIEELLERRKEGETSLYWLAKTANIEGRTHSVFSQARRMALHEAEHCEQLKTLFNANE